MKDVISISFKCRIEAFMYSLSGIKFTLSMALMHNLNILFMKEYHYEFDLS